MVTASVSITTAKKSKTQLLTSVSHLGAMHVGNAAPNAQRSGQNASVVVRPTLNASMKRPARSLSMRGTYLQPASYSA